MSRIGKKPIGVPEGVKASIVGQKVEITGPKGSREFVATEDVTLRPVSYTHLRAHET